MPHSSRSAIGLQVRVSLLVLMVTMVLLAGFAFWEHTLLREAEETQLRQETRLLADRAARLLALPLWNLDGPSARAIIQAEMDDPRVYGIAVFEQGRQLFEGMQRDASWRVVPWVGSAPPDVVEERRDLVVEGTQVGSLSIMVSPRFLAARLAERFQQAVWRYTLLAGILAVGLMLLVRSVLIAPLGRLGGVARRVTSEENFALRAPKGADDEIGELVDSFNAMLERIEQRNRLLGEQRRRLEMEVSERTAEFVGARERAERESKAMADFLAAITHEVRTPMTGIIGLLDISLRGQLEPRLREHLEIVRSSSHALLDVINGVLDFSRIEAGKLRIERIPFALRESVEDVLDLFRAHLAERDVALVLDMASDLPCKVAGDPTRLRQVLVNIVGNAFKFTEQGEIVVRISHERQGDGSVLLRFAVRDTGVGIPAEARKRLFEMFSQADASVARRFGGSGLGLAIARELVRLMGGSIEVDSTPGRGTVFRFTVHCGFVEGPSDPLPLPQGVRVVLGESHASLQRVLSGLLRRWGAEVVAVSGAAALKDAAADADVCVLSSHLQGGLAALSRPGQPGPPVLLLVPYGEEPEPSLCAGAGVVAFVGRPVRAATLRAALDAVFAPGMPDGAQATAMKGDMRAGLHIPSSRDGSGGASSAARVVEGQAVTGPMTQPGAMPSVGASGDGHDADQPVHEGASGLEGMRVLVAEDDDVSRLVLREMLTGFGVQVNETADGATMLAHFAAAPYDVVLIDVQMPVLDGFATLERLRALPDGDTVPVALFTAQKLSVAELAERGIRVAGVVEKPLEMETLVAFLRGLRAVKGQGRHDVAGADAAPRMAGQEHGESAVTDATLSPNAATLISGETLVLGGTDDGAATGGVGVPGMAAVAEVIASGGHETETSSSTSDANASSFESGAATPSSIPGDGASSHMPDAEASSVPAGVADVSAVAATTTSRSRAPRRLAGPPLPTALEGVDIGEVLTRVGGKEWLLLKVLRSFVTAYADAADGLAAMVEAGDDEAVKLRGHTLAGAAGNISAHELRAICLALEMGGDKSAQQSLVAAFRGELDRVVTSIREMLARYEEP